MHFINKKEKNCSLLILDLWFMQADDLPNFIQPTIGFNAKLSQRVYRNGKTGGEKERME